MIRGRFTIGFLLLVGVGIGAGRTAAQTPPAKKMALKVLYVGSPASDREKDFVAFLGKYFSEVKTLGLEQFSPAAAEKSDVVLLDYEGDGFKGPQPALPQSYTKPTVTLGVKGGLICSRLRLKTGYL